MDNGTRISPEIEKFLRGAKSQDLNGCQQQLEENPTLLNAAEAGGYTALHFAAFNGDLALIQLLLSKNAELNVQNFDGNTPLVMAVKGHQLKAIRLLVEGGADVNKSTEQGSTAIHHAASMGYVDCMHLLKELGATTFFDRTEAGTLLHWASHSGSIPCVGAVVYDLKVPLNAVDKHGGTSLMVAVHMQNLQVASFLLEHGADPNMAVPEDGTTALHVAIEINSLDAVKLLRRCGANAELKNKAGETPLDIAKTAGFSLIINELSKAPQTTEARQKDAEKVKNQGNAAFKNGENVKAAKFYSLAIQLNNANHVFFSNRAACYFNQNMYEQAYFDAVRCIELNSSFVRGYVRKSAICLALNRFDEAMEAANVGLKLDSANMELAHIRDEAFKKNRVA